MARRGRPPHPDVLTPREWEVLALLRDGLSNEQIAERLGVSLAGAKYHVSEILGKLGVQSREEAARWSAPGGRPWWVAAVAPIALLWRKASSGPLAAVAGGGAALAIAAGIGVLVWALVRTNGDGGSAVIAPSATQLPAGGATPTVLPAGTVTTACPGGPTIPATSTQLFAYTAADQTIWVAAPDGSNSTQLICDGRSGGLWSSSGRYMSYVANDGSLRILNAQTGEDFVADDGTASLITGGQGMQWSKATDLLVYQKSADINQNGHPQPTEIWSVKPGSAPSKVVDTQSRSFWLSPDGLLIAYVQPDENTPTPPSTSKEPLRESGEIFLVNANGSNGHKLTNGTFIAYGQSSPWSPDGRLLAFWRNVTGGSALSGEAYVLDLDTGHEVSIGNLNSDQHVQWSSDPNRYVFHNLAIDPQGQSAIPLFDPATSLIDWSPDGRKVAYMQSASSPPTPGGPAGAHSLVVLDIETGRRSTYETSTSAISVHQPGYPGVWSFDSRYFAFEGGEVKADGSPGEVIYVADTVARTTRRVLDSFVLGNSSFSYSPDGSYLLVQQRSGGSTVLSVAAPDGSGLSKVADGAVANGAAGWTGWRPQLR